MVLDDYNSFVLHVPIYTGALATTVFGPGEGGPVLLSEVQCTGTETQLNHCPSTGLGQHNCGLQDTTGVFCDTRGMCFHMLCIFSSFYTQIERKNHIIIMCTCGFEFCADNLTRCLNESGQPPESQNSVEHMERYDTETYMKHCIMCLDMTLILCTGLEFVSPTMAVLRSATKY